jgi:hypothetical protein
MNDSDLQVSFWVLTLRPFARKALPFVLLALDALLIGLAALGGFRFVRTEIQNDALAVALSQNTVQTTLLQERLQHPTPVIVSAALLPSGGKQYTLLATVRNPSQRWAATSLGYTMSVGETVIAQGTTTLYPGEEKYLVAAGQVLPESAPLAGAVSVALTDASWVRSTAERSLPKMEIDVLYPLYRVLSNDTPALSQIVATVKNGSVAAYPEVEVVAVLMRGQTPLAVATVLLQDLAGEEKRPVDLRLYGAYDATNAVVKASPTALPDF